VKEREREGERIVKVQVLDFCALAFGRSYCGFVFGEEKKSSYLRFFCVLFLGVFFVLFWVLVFVGFHFVRSFFWVTFFCCFCFGRRGVLCVGVQSPLVLLRFCKTQKSSEFVTNR
jgi:hypothetical protein